MNVLIEGVGEGKYKALLEYLSSQYPKSSIKLSCQVNLISGEIDGLYASFHPSKDDDFKEYTRLNSMKEGFIKAWDAVHCIPP